MLCATDLRHFRGDEPDVQAPLLNTETSEAAHRETKPSLEIELIFRLHVQN